MAKFFILLIRCYRKLLFPFRVALGLHGSCRFQPTCSAYAEEALRKYGFFKGGRLAVKRILRCHPWGGSGYDPVP